MTIELTIRLPGELHRRLEIRAEEKGRPLDQVLLEELEKVLETELETEAEPTIKRERVLEALHSTGLIQPISAELVQRYVSDPEHPRQKPLKIPGQPLSEVIIEQRGKL